MNISPIKAFFFVMIARVGPMILPALLGFNVGCLFGLYAGVTGDHSWVYALAQDAPDGGPELPDGGQSCQLDGGAVEAGTVVCGDQMVISIDRSTSIAFTGQNLWMIDRATPMWIYVLTP